VVYEPIYSIKFKSNVNDLAAGNGKIKDGLAKAIPFILEKPYYKSEKVKGEGDLMRKHVCADNFRIFYYVDEKNKRVIFTMLRPKNKNTYKNL